MRLVSCWVYIVLCMCWCGCNVCVGVCICFGVVLCMCVCASVCMCRCLYLFRCHVVYLLYMCRACMHNTCTPHEHHDTERMHNTYTTHTHIHVWRDSYVTWLICDMTFPSWCALNVGIGFKVQFLVWGFVVYGLVFGMWHEFFFLVCVQSAKDETLQSKPYTSRTKP